MKFIKINLLKINATFFDSLGLISPITLQGKLLFKLLCIDKSDWDDELNDIIKQNTVQKMKFSIKDFFSKCDQIRRKLYIWSRLLKKSLMENFIFCVVKVFEIFK